jgi:hypothetical protein
MQTCPHCQADIDPGDQFCASCGARQSAPISASPPSAQAPPEAHPALLPEQAGCPDRVLKFGCASVIILAVMVGIVAAFGLRQPGGSPPQSLEYLRPDERADHHAGFAVRFSNTSNAEIVNPQIQVIANVGD